MASTLNPGSIGKNKGVQLNTLSNYKLLRSKRVKSDLDNFFVETDTQAKSKFLRLPYINLYIYPIDTSDLGTISKKTAIENKIGVFSIRGKTIYAATPEPGHNKQKIIIEALKSEGRDVKLYLCSDVSFEKLIRCYEFVVTAKAADDDITVNKQIIQNIENDENSLQNLPHLINKISLSEIIETILGVALHNKASDIHFEPSKENYVLRLRLDGVLHTFAEFPKDMQHALESRIKLLSSLKLNVDDRPQDGRFSFNTEDKEIDVRVSMIPSNYGYSIVMRLLGTGNVTLAFDSLGFTGIAKKRIEDAIQKPQGMIISTGPTGSGKTTTLYTILNTLVNGERKIITLEDPIEYRLQGVSQTQINQEAGYTFADGLKSILRQDPDIIMIGEIRDKETADISVQSSLTGHKVLSTIHTNDAAGSIPRFLEMGIKSFLLADSLEVIIAQRLVRKICQHCKVHDHLADEQKETIKSELRKINEISEVDLTNLKFFTSLGCTKCDGLGYKGRIGVYEVMYVSSKIKSILYDHSPSIMEIRDIAHEEGMVSMLQDGILKAGHGITDIKELFRVVM